MDPPLELPMELLSPSRSADNLTVRLEYRKVYCKTQEKGLEDSNVLSKSFERADHLFSSVKAPREAVCDAALINLQSHILKQKTQALHLSTFKPDSFAEKLLSLYRRQKVSDFAIWKELGKESKLTITSSPAFHFIYGTFEPDPVEVKKKVRRDRGKDDQNKAIQKPSEVDPATSKGQQTTEEVERILSILLRLREKQGSSVSYFEFVTNPSSFAETVENMFHVAILVKEGAVTIYQDRDGHPFIDPITPDVQASMKIHGRYSQAIFSINQRDWERIIQEFGITKPRIPSKKRNCS